MISLGINIWWLFSAVITSRKWHEFMGCLVILMQTLEMPRQVMGLIVLFCLIEFTSFHFRRMDRIPFWANILYFVFNMSRLGYWSICHRYYWSNFDHVDYYQECKPLLSFYPEKSLIAFMFTNVIKIVKSYLHNIFTSYSGWDCTWWFQLWYKTISTVEIINLHIPHYDQPQNIHAFNTFKFYPLLLWKSSTYTFLIVSNHKIFTCSWHPTNVQHCS